MWLKTQRVCETSDEEIERFAPRVGHADPDAR
jgi:hypothetical protein